MNKQQILTKRLNTLEKHRKALAEYKAEIDRLQQTAAPYRPETFTDLTVTERALFEAYLKRFASLYC